MFQLQTFRLLKLTTLLLGLLLGFKGDSFHLLSHTETAEEKNRIYIANLSIADDVPETIRESITTKLKSHLVEKFGASYNIISQSDLDLLLRQVESLQRQGRDTKEILSEIADARDADELIHGKVFKDQGQIKLLLNNLKRDPKSKDFYTKSIVDISFFENDFDFYIKEAAIKILNPHYKIKSGESVIAAEKKNSISKPDTINYSENKIVSIGNIGWGNFEGLMKWDEAVDK